ncbi:hypothetical protein PENSPDRAFT_734914 [Peniophora sp. CONT]|nr:hypothetical protein PENSPDRAFT_734914 [Peniophora sp. CONT]
MFKLGRPPVPSRPRTPVPEFKYLKNPAQCSRNYAHRHDPFPGDFCVVSIDHVASVAHLGPEVMEAAKRIPSARYVAYVCMSNGIPYEGKRTNSFSLSLVCQGVPPTSAWCDETPACIPIIPNDERHGGRQPLEACAPFPWPECYISTFTTKDCRVTTAKRDYSPVLCVPALRTVAKTHRVIAKDSFSLGDFYDSRHAGDTKALARLPFSPSPEPSSDPLAFLPPAPEDSFSETTVTLAPTSTTNRPDESNSATVSVSTTDAPVTAYSPKSLEDLTSRTAVNVALASALFGSGDTDDPVVDVWYDLDMVSEVRDPELFMKECEMLDLLRMHYERLRKTESASHREGATKKSSSPPPSAEPSISSVLFDGPGTHPTSVPIPLSASIPLAFNEGVEGRNVSEVAPTPAILPSPEPTVAAAATSYSDPKTVADASSSDTLTGSTSTTTTRLTSPMRPLADAPQSSAREDKARRTASLSRRIVRVWSPKTAINVSTSGSPDIAPPSTSRSLHRSASRTSLHSSKDASASSASPTKREFVKHHHPYATERSTRGTSSISYAVPRPRHDSLKSLKKSRSSSSLKAPRRAATLPVTRSLK